ncbi:Lsr2 family protein [Micromonospora aurantiaca]|uniref:histone-like nucleoid-structuring protein Lsr2 n=1 Tax=Micromonospora aurantiaca (nom. illeg.) TaxID=47850 RepID=UPI000F40E9CB|nr:Lsr2 family protein [Micromonospora aurantiaca]RNH98851.1 Lsr2 family protein [Micromonospora aurantiaca]
MAKQIIHKLVDDLDGGDADETVRFALDGVQYEIDLSASNAEKLRDLLALYTSHGTKIGRGGVAVGGRAARISAGSASSRSARGATAVGREQNKAIRDWAKRAGKKISDRGRIPQDVVDEYHGSAGR